MTTPRQLAANRRNARLSTGPRSALGKRRVALNALRHGLSVAVPADPALAKEIVELAEGIADGSTDPEVQERARGVAVVQIDLERVRQARQLVIARRVSAGSTEEAFRREIRELVALDRYERRTMSRRKRATRAFQAALFRSIGGEQ